MATNSTKVDVAVTGAVSYAPVGSTAPTNATSALAVAYVDVGYLNEDGVAEVRDRSTSNLVAWQNSDVVRTVVTEASVSVKITMIETNKASVELFYGAALDTSDGSVEIVASATGGRKSLVVDYIDGAKFCRLWLPQAEVLEVDEVAMAGGAAVGYPATIYGYPDSALGFSAKKWWSDLVVP